MGLAFDGRGWNGGFAADKSSGHLPLDLSREETECDVHLDRNKYLNFIFTQTMLLILLR